jgi:hypothetical protein
MSKRACQCGACGKVFNSLRLFDYHRVGKYRDQHPDYGRVCRNSLHLALHGASYDPHKGIWTAPVSQRDRERLTALRAKNKGGGKPQKR